MRIVAGRMGGLAVHVRGCVGVVGIGRADVHVPCGIGMCRVTSFGFLLQLSGYCPTGSCSSMPMVLFFPSLSMFML